jgi:hypothetical protein
LSVTAANPLRAVREELGLAREKVTAQLNPPLSAKTLERWEKNGEIPRRNGSRRVYLPQLARLYGCLVRDLEASEEVAA